MKMGSPFLKGSASWDQMDFQKHAGNYNKNIAVLVLKKLFRA